MNIVGESWRSGGKLPKFDWRVFLLHLPDTFPILSIPPWLFGDCGPSRYIYFERGDCGTHGVQRRFGIFFFSTLKSLFAIV